MEEQNQNEIMSEVEHIAKKGVISGLAASGLYSKLELNPEWVELKMLHFEGLPTNKVRYCFQQALDESSPYLDLVLKGKFKDAFLAIDDNERGLVAFHLRELVESEYSWDLINQESNNCGLEALIEMRSFFRGYENFCKDQLTEILGEDFHVTVPLPDDTKEFDTILKEILSEKGPFAYQLSREEILEANAQALAYEKLQKEDRHNEGENMNTGCN